MFYAFIILSASPGEWQQSARGGGGGVHHHHVRIDVPVILILMGGPPAPL